MPPEHAIRYSTYGAILQSHYRRQAGLPSLRRQSLE